MPEKLKIEEKKASPETEIDPEVERRLKTIAQRVGGDFGMKLEIIPAGKRPTGEPELGTYFNPKETKIVFDPEDVKRDPQEAEFIAGHEGGHRAITRGPESIDLKKEKAEEIYRQLGFAFTFNALEDPADNNWIREKFPGLESNIKKTYDKMLEASDKEDTPLGLSHPEALQSTRLLGYVPKFVHYGSEIVKYWHKGELSKNLDPEVKKALDKTKKEAEEYFKTIPGSKPTEKQIIEKAKERFLVNYEKIWPEAKKLVNKDLNDEKLRQMLKQAMEQQGKGKPKKGEGEGEGEGGENPLDKLPKDLQKELQDKVKQGEKELKESGKEGEGATPIPMDKLSDGLKKKLKEAFDSLPEEQKKDLQEKAEQQLKELEDKLNEELEGKLNQDNPESHQQRVVRVKREQGTKGKRQKEKKEVERARKEFEKRLEAGMSEYDKAYKEVKPLIDDLYRQLLKIFIPEKHPRWKAGYPSGSKLNLPKAMQYEADRSKYTELWQRKTIPRKIDYRFSLLIDLSSSMSGEKIEQTFRGLVVLTETLNRLDLKHEIIGFTSSFARNVKVYKEFKNKLSKDARDKISSMRRENMGSTPTSSATEFTSERLEENKGKHNFLITLTDGEPFPESSSLTKDFIKEARKTTNQKFIGLGLGSDTEHVKELYPNHIANISVKELPRKLAILFEEIIRHPTKY